MKRPRLQPRALPPRAGRPPEKAPDEIHRGDLFWVDCDPSVGAEPRKTRTCVIVSNDVANLRGGMVSLVTTQAWTAERAKRVFMVDLRRPRSTMEAPRLANASVVMTYDRSRLRGRVGKVHADAMTALDSALSLHLGLRPI